MAAECYRLGTLPFTQPEMELGTIKPNKTSIMFSIAQDMSRKVPLLKSAKIKCLTAPGGKTAICEMVGQKLYYTKSQDPGTHANNEKGKSREVYEHIQENADRIMVLH